jgi:hypothetical protein
MAITSMTYRKLSDGGDYTFGMGASNFYVNTPEAVAQAVQTRLGLIQGEWFLDVTAGTPYLTKILGAGMITTYDQAIQEVILNTPGVQRITSYNSTYNSTARSVQIVVTIDTVFGTVTLSAAASNSGKLLDISFVLGQSTIG